MIDPISIDDLIYSKRALKLGIDNNPTDAIREMLRLTCALMERVQLRLGYPIEILSGYRCQKLNIIVGGSKNSYHMRGEACDFVCPLFGLPIDVAKELEPCVKELGIDQLIFEGTWVHVGFSATPRHQILTKRFNKYEKGIIA